MGARENAQQLNYDAAGGGAGEASGGINSTFRGVNMTHHQRRTEEKEKNDSAVRGASTERREERRAS